MLVRYYADFNKPALARASAPPEDGDWEEITWQQALLIARGEEGWVVVPIHELDKGFLAGDGWSHFMFQPTEQQRFRCVQNHGRPLEEIKEGLMWSELWAVLTDNMWRRIVPMRAFTLCRDWPKSEVI